MSTNASTSTNSIESSNINSDSIDDNLVDSFSKCNINNNLKGKTITLVSSDKKHFDIQYEHAIISNMISAALSGSNDTTLDLNIKSDVLNLIVQYMRHHKGDIVTYTYKRPIISSNMLEIIENDDFGVKLLDVDGEFLCDIVEGVSYLDIKPLQVLSCLKCATLIYEASKLGMVELLKLFDTKFLRMKNLGVLQPQPVLDKLKEEAINKLKESKEK